VSAGFQSFDALGEWDKLTREFGSNNGVGCGKLLAHLGTKLVDGFQECFLLQPHLSLDLVKLS
jgi:hypothetical protein